MSYAPIPLPGCAGKYKTTTKDYLIIIACLIPILAIVIFIAFGLSYCICSPMAGVPAYML